MSTRPKLVGDPEHIDPLLAFGEPVDAPQPGLQEHCHVCGLVNGGCFGFGVLRGRLGVWACTDHDCQAEAKARARMTTSTLIAAE